MLHQIRIPERIPSGTSDLAGCHSDCSALRFNFLYGTRDFYSGGRKKLTKRNFRRSFRKKFRSGLGCLSKLLFLYLLWVLEEMDCAGSKTHEYPVVLKGSSAESEEEPQEWTGLEGKVAVGRKAPEALWIGMKGEKGRRVKAYGLQSTEDKRKEDTAG
ncbi:hypothetical protein E2C01_054562 [Portunus trituberculatus]|uniref:Uncharacterized protein n=1 Tax=Portunus trituberculatus TaxID=210409 RepID=A0A5B7GT02_PORTR|nr:hypothetical protein [Portunus trituberculatus]